jgi:hypothetical protein
MAASGPAKEAAQFKSRAVKSIAFWSPVRNEVMVKHGLYVIVCM